MGGNHRSNTENRGKSRLLEENKSFLRAVSSSWTVNVARGLSDLAGTGCYAAGMIELKDAIVTSAIC